MRTESRWLVACSSGPSKRFTSCRSTCATHTMTSSLRERARGPSADVCSSTRRATVTTVAASVSTSVRSLAVR